MLVNNLFVLLCFTLFLSLISATSLLTHEEALRLYPSKKDKRIVNNTFRYLETLSRSRYVTHGCGSWQQKYTDIHNAIMDGKRKPRYVVSIAPPQGLADRLAGQVTQFLLALLSNRAFLVTNGNDSLPMNVAFDHINIRSEIADDFMNPRDILMNLTFDEYPASIDRAKSCPLYLNAGSIISQYEIVEKRNNRIFLYGDLSKEPVECANSETIYVTSNRGYSWRMFDNPYHRQQLLSMGLRRETTFKCVVDYLYRLKPSACSGKCVAMKESILNSRKEGVIVIAIQVRIGDIAFEPNFDLKKLGYDPSENHFKCANKIANRFSMIGRDTIFFFISDSQQLRKKAKLIYGGRLITDDDFQPKHVFNNNDLLDKQAQVEAMTSSASDMMLFSLAHIHVISRSSGFGQKAAFLSEASNKIHIFIGNDGDKCTLTKFSQDSAKVWSGV